MPSEILEKKLSKTWKKLLKANTEHDQYKIESLQKEIIGLEIEQKRQRR